MDGLLNQIGNRILSRRKQLRMTQDELAEKAGITPQTVSTAELGKKALRPENIIRICSALDVSTDYLLLGEVNSHDHSALSSRVSDLSPAQPDRQGDVGIYGRACGYVKGTVQGTAGLLSGENKS